MMQDKLVNKENKDILHQEMVTLQPKANNVDIVSLGFLNEGSNNFSSLFPNKKCHHVLQGVFLLGTPWTVRIQIPILFSPFATVELNFSGGAQ